MFGFRVFGADITPKRLKGLRQLIELRGVEQAYVITWRWEDFGPRPVESLQPGREREVLAARVLQIPAPLACYWLSG